MTCYEINWEIALGSWIVMMFMGYAFRKYVVEDILTKKKKNKKKKNN